MGDFGLPPRPAWGFRGEAPLRKGEGRCEAQGEGGWRAGLVKARREGGFGLQVVCLRLKARRGAGFRPRVGYQLLKARRRPGFRLRVGCLLRKARKDARLKWTSCL